MTIPTEIAMATFLVGFVGCVAVGIGAAVPLTADTGGGGGGWFCCWVLALPGSSGKNGWSGSGNWGLEGGGGGGEDSGGGAEVAGNSGWWRTLL